MEAIDDPSGPLGIRLVAQHEGERVRLASERARLEGESARALLVLPLEASIVEVLAGALQPVVDRTSFLSVPARSFTALTARSPVARTLVLSVAPELVARVAESYAGAVDAERLRRYLDEPQLLPRTTWVNEVCHRYLFERAECARRDNDATRFLESEMVKELYFLCHERQRDAERPSLVVGRSAMMQRALLHIEAHLFEPGVLRGLGRVCGASASTLLRGFRRELGSTPQAYVRARRLDESLLLLKSRRHTVGEIAGLVGYRNLAAFSHAFRARFGVRPSDVSAKLADQRGERGGNLSLRR